MKSLRISFPLIITLALAGSASSIGKQGSISTEHSTLVYVAPDAREPCDGSRTHPFSSLETARDYLRSVKRSNPQAGNMTMVLCGGTYTLNNAFTLGFSDSGITIRNENRQTVIISGGRKISQWSPYRSGIYKARAHGLKFRQFYINGQRAVLARYPNLTSESDMGPYCQVQEWNDEKQQCIVRNEDLNNISQIQGSELVVKKHWDQSILRIAGVDHLRQYAFLNFMDPEKKTEWHFPFPPRAAGQTFFVQNSLALLDAPGEWYLDEKADTVYYKPRALEDMRHIQVVVPAIDRVVNIDGAHDIHIQNIQFAYTNWLISDDRRIGTQSGYRFTEGFSEAVPGGIRVTDSTNVAFTDCDIRNMGGTGIELAYGDDHCTIDGCWFRDIASTGIMVYTDTIAPNPPEQHKCRYDRISNCTVSRVGRDYTGAAGINATYPKAITIEHNEISDCPYVGISVGWGWTHDYSTLEDNIIQYNNVHDVMLLHDDSAGIYVLSNQKPPGSSGTHIEKNWVHDIHISAWAEANPISAIYLDNESDGIVVDNNVITNVPQAVNLNTPHLNSLTNNDSRNTATIADAGPLRRKLTVRSKIFTSRLLPIGRPSLSSNSIMRSGEFITSANHKYFALLQHDGDLAVYPGAGPRPQGAALWHTDTKQQSGVYHALMQEDANFCLTKVDPQGHSNWLWDTRPLGPNGAYFVIVEDDGSLAIYHGHGPLNHGPKAWDSSGYREGKSHNPDVVP